MGWALVKIYRIELRRTLKLALPIALGNMAQIILQVIDSVMIGRVGVVPLAAAAFAGSVYAVLLVFGMAASTFMSTYIGRAYGARNYSEVGEVFRHGLVIMLAIGLLIGIIVNIVAFNLHWFDQEPEVRDLARFYLIMLGWSSVPLALFQVCRQFCESLEDATIPMKVVIVGILLNVFLNWVFIYGNLGLPALGLDGAGIATFLVRFLGMLMLVLYVFQRKPFRQFFPKKWVRPLDSVLIRKCLHLGIPSGLQGLFEVGAFGAAAIMVGWIGAQELAAHQIAINMCSITFMIVLGVSFAANIRVGYAAGREDYRAAQRVGLGAISFSFVLMFCFGLIFYFGRNYFPSLYIDDQEVQAIAARLLIVGALFQIFDGSQAVSIGCLRGLTDIIIPTGVTLVAYWVVGLGSAYLLAFSFGLDEVGVWVGLAASLGVASALLLSRFFVLTRRLRLSSC